MMTPERFQDLLDMHGADLATWPRDEAAQARALLAQSAEARARLEASRALDAALAGALGRETAPPLLKAAIARIPDRQRRVSPPVRATRIWWEPWRMAASAAAISLLLGFMMGSAGIWPVSDSDEIADIGPLAYGTPFEWEDLP